MYLDPGFGSMLIQLLLAGIATLGTGWFVFRKKIASFFSKKKNEDELEDAEEFEIEDEDFETENEEFNIDAKEIETGEIDGQ